MKIYFSGSIRGGRDDRAIYLEIINLLKEYGEVLTEHVGDHKLTAQGEVDLDDEYIYERDMAWLKESDAVVADVSTPSIGVGYEVAYAEVLDKKILCLYRDGAEKRISGMIGGNKNLKIEIYKTVEDLPLLLKDFFKSS